LFCTTIALAQSEADYAAKVDRALALMSTADKLKLLGGNGMFTFAVPSSELPAIKMSDGPVGVRTWGTSTAYPAGISLAATWDPEMARKEGAALAADARLRGVSILLAPGVNIYRAPMNGRNFEYLGEDPFLAGRMAVGYIQGVQGGGVSATVKHFVANNSEFDRHNTNAVIDERTLHEIYLPAFEAAIRDAHVSALMDSYNLVNGQHMTQNGALNIGVLRDEWHFDGVVMSDWSATYDGVAAVNGGLDLEMPKAKFMTPEVLQAALSSHKLSMATVDAHVRRILLLSARYGLLGTAGLSGNDHPDELPDSRAVAYKAAAEGIVLLKNDGSLPIHPSSVKSVAVIGPNVEPPAFGGGGSSRTTAYATPTFVESLQKTLGPDVRVKYSPGMMSVNEICAATHFEDGLEQAAYVGGDFSGTAQKTHISNLNNWVSSFRIGGGPGGKKAYRWKGTYAAAEAGDYLVLVTAHGRDSFTLTFDGKTVLDHASSEGVSPQSVVLPLQRGQRVSLQLDYVQQGKTNNAGLGIRPVRELVLAEATSMARTADMAIVNVGMSESYESEAFDRPWEMLPGQNELVEAVLAANPRTAVVLNSGGGLDIASWVDRVPVLLHGWYGGEEGEHALADVLTGRVSPSGKLPISFERSLADNPSTKNYYPKDKTVDVPYSEGIFVGYRNFDRSSTKALFPFGFGLSYTTFAMDHLSVQDHGGGSVEVDFDVRNTGKVVGDEIAQVYVSEQNAPLPRPVKELKGFRRVHLAPGEKVHVSVLLDSRSFSYWDVTTHDWKRDAGGRFKVLVGNSSLDLPLELELTLR
jgi:beta-glucosidase